MNIVATRKNNKIVVVSGQMRLMASIESAGYATILLDGKEVTVELNQQNELIEKQEEGRPV